MLKAATHSGTFHADDVFAYAILRAATDGRIELIRSRDAAILAAADIVFDVGGAYDAEHRRYDHHMRDRPQRATNEPYSSAGLIWRDFSAAAIRNLVPSAAPDTVARIAAMVDGGLIRDIDLMDNGAMAPTPGHFSTLIETFNPTFVENGDEDAAFLQAAEMATNVLARVCAKAHAAAQAEAIVATAATAAEDPRVIVLDTRVPWEDAIFSLGLTQALYVVRPAGEQWTCSAVPPSQGSFGQRLPLPDDWAGLRDDVFAQATGIPDATFCHPARFVCGARSREGAVKLAMLATA